jgi:uncharacterized protein (DUF885 family)
MAAHDSEARPMTQLDEIAASHLDRLAEIDPVWATSVGRLDHETELADRSPAGVAARADLARSTLAAAEAAPVEGDRDRVALDVMRDRLSVLLDAYDAGEWVRPLRIIGSPVQSTRMVFDIMAHEDDGDWAVIAERMAKVPASLAGLTETLREGLRRNVVAARRQALACSEQARSWAGGAGEPGYFRRMVAGYKGQDARLTSDLSAAAAAADASYGELAVFLRESYAPGATDVDAVGRERYALGSRECNGLAVDPEATYAWGFEELHRIEAEMVAAAGELRPGAGVSEAIELLESDPKRAIEGAEAFRQWNQAFLDDTISALDGRHFDIAEPVRRVEAMLAPPGGAAAMYYTGPSKDFSRPGRTWYPTMGRTRFPLWVEASTAYHEGAPGHHLQIATIVWLGDRVAPFQQEIGTSGQTEGWALYAERLMGELGFLDDPGYRLGMLAAHAFRAARVVVDIGLHHGFSIPAGEAYHPSEPWTPELAVPFMAQASGRTREFAASEVDRYLGWPGQAISYKVGERTWLETREAARRRLGPGFDLKQFHRDAFELGLVGLTELRRELGDGPTA